MLANGPAVDEHRLALERLDEIRLDRVLQEHGHGACRPELLGGHRLALVRGADRDRAQALAQVVQVAGDGDDRHHLRCRGDVEAGLAGVAVGAPAEPHDDVAERTVVDVDAAAPGDRERIELQLVAVQEVRVEHGRQQVVGGADRVDVAGEVEVHVLHRHDLRVAGSGGAALDAEHRADRGLSQAQHGPLAELAEGLGQRHGRRRLALAGRGRCDRRDVDQLPVRTVGEPSRTPRSTFALYRP